MPRTQYSSQFRYLCHSYRRDVDDEVILNMKYNISIIREVDEN